MAHNLSDAEPAPAGAEWERVIDQVFDGELKTGMIDRVTAIATAQHYFKGVTEGFGGGFAKVDYDSPDYGLLRNLERNCYQFAGAKNYQTLRQLNDLLRDGDRLRTRNEFKKEARKVVHEWNGHWQDIEYNTAVNSAINARKWQEFDSRKDIMPLLQFKIVGDERTCGICKPFADMVRPFNDPVWSYATPSLHFGDRCTIIQLPDTTADITAEVPPPDAIPKIFRVNMAKEQLAFPPDHPYYKGLPKKLDKEVLRLQRTEVRHYAKEQFAGKSYKTIIGDVSVGMNGIKEALDQPHSSFYEKNTAVKSLDKLLKGATYTNSAADRDGVFAYYHYLETSINKKPSWIVIKETRQGVKHFHSIVDKLKK